MATQQDSTRSNVDEGEDEGKGEGEGGERWGWEGEVERVRLGEP